MFTADVMPAVSAHYLVGLRLLPCLGMVTVVVVVLVPRRPSIVAEIRRPMLECSPRSDCRLVSTLSTDVHVCRPLHWLTSLPVRAGLLIRSSYRVVRRSKLLVTVVLIVSSSLPARLLRPRVVMCTSLTTACRRPWHNSLTTCLRGPLDSRHPTRPALVSWLQLLTYRRMALTRVVNWLGLLRFRVNATSLRVARWTFRTALTRGPIPSVVLSAAARRKPVMSVTMVSMMSMFMTCRIPCWSCEPGPRHGTPLDHSVCATY